MKKNELDTSGFCTLGDRMVCSTLPPEAACIHTDEFAALRCGVRRAIVLPAHPQRRFTEPGHSIHATPVPILIL